MKASTKASLMGTVVASVTATIAWFAGVPQRIWPQHPIIALVIIAIVIETAVKMSWPVEHSRE